MLTTTLAALREEPKACAERYSHLCRALGPEYEDNTPISMVKILETNGLPDCLWALAVKGGAVGRQIVLSFAADCAARVVPIWEAAYPGDNHSGRATAIWADRAVQAIDDAAISAKATWATKDTPTVVRAIKATLKLRAARDAAEANKAVAEANKAASEANTGGFLNMASWAAWGTRNAAEAFGAAWAAEVTRAGDYGDRDEYARAANDARLAARAIEENWQAAHLRELLEQDQQTS